MISRIEKIMNDKEMTVTQFADFINVQRPSMSHIISGRNNPSLDFVTKVLVAFPEINSDWLLFGNGEAYRSDNSVNGNSSDEVPIKSKENELEDDLFSFNEPNVSIQEVENQEISDEVIDYPADEIIDKTEIEIVDKIEEDRIEQPQPQSPANIESKKEQNDEKIKLIKVLFFYNNNTFVEYYPQ